MEKRIVMTGKLLITAMLILASSISFAQTSKDTVKTDKSNDPMVVDPGEVNDSMTMKPAVPNDEMAALTDTGFISKNIMDNMMEIKLAKLGQSKGRSAQVRKVAALLIKDHTIMLSDLKKLALKKNFSQKDDMHAMHATSLNIPSGSNFDKTWATEMLTMHEAKIAELESYINLTTDDDIKALAGKALPKIKLHQQMLMKIPGAISKTRLAVL